MQEDESNLDEQFDSWIGSRTSIGFNSCRARGRADGPAVSLFTSVPT